MTHAPHFPAGMMQVQLSAAVLRDGRFVASASSAHSRIAAIVSGSSIATTVSLSPYTPCCSSAPSDALVETPVRIPSTDTPGLAAAKLAQSYAAAAKAGNNDVPYCQRTTASGHCRLRPAGAERSWFGNGISGWSVRLYVSERKTPVRFTTASLGKLAVVKASLADFQSEPRRASADSSISTASCRLWRAATV